MRVQQPPRSLQKAQVAAQEGSKSCPRRPKSVQDRPRASRSGPKTPPRGPRRPRNPANLNFRTQSTRNFRKKINFAQDGRDPHALFLNPPPLLRNSPWGSRPSCAKITVFQNFQTHLVKTHQKPLQQRYGSQERAVGPSSLALGSSSLPSGLWAFSSGVFVFSWPTL